MVLTQSQPRDRSLAIVPIPYFPLQRLRLSILYLVNEEDEETYASKANFLGCGYSGAPYGTTISASDMR